MHKIEMRYILLKKYDENKIKTFKFDVCKHILRELFTNVNDETFEIEISGDIYIIYYDESKEFGKDTYYFNLYIEDTRDRAARALGKVNGKLMKSKFRKDYSIINAFDGVSMHYCNKIYPKINLFERKIRQLIYIILIKALGTEWYKETVSCDLKEVLKRQTKGMSNSRLIEKGLYEMTIGQLEDYLFLPFRSIEGNDLIDDILSKNRLRNKSKEDIIIELKNSSLKNIWTRFFEGEIEIFDLKNKLVLIRNLRNKVAHSKEFYESDYYELNGLLNGLIKQIDEAIINIESKSFDKMDANEALVALSKSIQTFTETFKSNIEKQFDFIESREIIKNTLVKFSEKINEDLNLN